MRTFSTVLVGLLLALSATPLIGQDGPTADEAKAGLLKAVKFFHEKVAAHGGYVWKTSTDLQRREGEGKCTPTMVWVQPPATPAVGEAFLDAYDATGDAECLQAARDTGMALVKGQLHSGGWDYFIEFDPEKRKAFAYRDVPLSKKHVNRSTLDDDTTQASLRFLVRLDKALDFKDEKIHECVQYGFDALLKAQFPNGGWYAWWDGKLKDRKTADYPVKKASLSETYKKTWPKDFQGCYVLNDDLMQDLVNTLLVAYDVYQDERYLKAAEKGGEFLLLAQLPEPQPAWAQQYNKDMIPDWSRKFEPPAVTGGESQGVMETLIVLYQRTGRKDFLEPLPRAIAYLRKSQLPDGQLARFYEMQTNKPLYFTKGDYKLVYDDGKLPTHYGFKLGHRLDRIEKSLADAVKGNPAPTAKKPSAPSTRQKSDVAAILKAMDSRGAWVDKGKLKSDVGPVPDGVILSERFIANVGTLSKYVQASHSR